VVDDGSTDNCDNVAREYAERDVRVPRSRASLARAGWTAPGWWRCWAVVGTLALPLAFPPISGLSDWRASRTAGR
jgi:hypothetical protein